MLDSATYTFETTASVGDWWVSSFKLEEALSTPYLCTVELYQPEEAGDEPTAFLAASAAVVIARGDTVEQRVCGVIQNVTRLGVTLATMRVRLELVPALALLGQRQDSRIFQEMDAIAILQEVLEGAFGDYDRALNTDGLSRDTYPTREYEVQYQETDLEFVTRLMQEEGINYSFNHEGETEELSLFDKNQACPDCELVSGSEIPLRYVGEADEVESIQSFERRSQEMPTSVVVRDVDWTRPHVDFTREARAEDPQGRDRELYLNGPVTNIGEYKSPSYGAEDGQDQAHLRQEAEKAQEVLARGLGIVTGLRPGVRFTLEGHVDATLDADYIVQSVNHEGANDWGGQEIRSRYQNHFTCLAAEPTIRPPRDRGRDRDRMLGPQTATVVGPSAEEIHTDEHGRIKVQFHWDRVGANDENSSCWVRVMQTWSGPGFGAVFLPRIGMEVIVHFISGDPSRPIVTGCTYNGINPPPYTLPDNKTKATWFSNSSIGGGGHNELTFEDAKGSEQLYMQAQGNMDTLVKNDQTLKVGGNRDTTVDGNETLAVGGNRDTGVIGNRNAHIAGSQETTIDSGETKTVSSGQTVTIDGGQKTEITGGQEVKISGGQTVTINGGRTTEIQGFNKLTVNSPQERNFAGPWLETVLGKNEKNVKADQSQIVLGVDIEHNAGTDTGKCLGIGKNENLVGAKEEAIGGILLEQSGGITRQQEKAQDTEKFGAYRALAMSAKLSTPSASIKMDFGSTIMEAGSGNLTITKADIFGDGEKVRLEAGPKTEIQGSKVVIDADSISSKGVIDHPDFKA